MGDPLFGMIFSPSVRTRPSLNPLLGQIRLLTILEVKQRLDQRIVRSLTLTCWYRGS